MRSQTVPCALFAAAFLVTFQAQAQTNVYRWVDKDGNVQFSDAPPPEDARGVTQKRLGGGYVDETLPYATQLAMRRNPVTLYTGGDCGRSDLCTRGRELLSQRGVPFTERDVQSNPADGETLKKLIGALEVPVLVVGESNIKGYEEDAWQGALDSAGYPRERAPGQGPSRAVIPPPPPVKPEPAPNATEPAATK